MRKFQKFFANITHFASHSRKVGVRDEIKRKLGHSTNNNRTLSVQQAIDHLARNLNYMAVDLARTYAILKPQIKAKRTRTDAIDLTEFVSTYRTVVMNKRKLRRQIGSALKG